MDPWPGLITKTVWPKQRIDTREPLQQRTVEWVSNTRSRNRRCGQKEAPCELWGWLRGGEILATKAISKHCIPCIPDSHLRILLPIQSEGQVYVQIRSRRPGTQAGLIRLVLCPASKEASRTSEWGHAAWCIRVRYSCCEGCWYSD